MSLTRRVWLQSAAAVAAASGIARGGAAAAEPNEELASLAERRVGGIPRLGIAIGTIQDGVVRRLFSGAADAARALDSQTIFEIGSVTKTFTATLLAEMVRRGEVAFDDPIEKFLPKGVSAPVYNERRITLVDLATQSSGLPTLPTNMKPANAMDPYADYKPELL